MRRYVLDTGILLHYTRKSLLYQTIENNERLTDPDCAPFVSVVSVGEIFSIATQRSWGQPKIEALKNLLAKLIVLDINSNDQKLINTYAEIDSYSKNKLSTNKLGRSITMGKNDLWIASTSKIANATLLTTDGDFDHLHGTYLTVKKY